MNRTPMTGSFEALAEAVCATCGAQCCYGAHPPLSPGRIAILRERGVPHTAFECNGYTRIHSDQDGLCIMCIDGRCRIHAFKPETCVAGPFTFEVADNRLRLFLKHESICPLVPYLKADERVYETQFQNAAQILADLVRSLPSRELDVINAIPEPETDLVAEIPLDPGGDCIP
ncbi:MAG: YkgJ family cysteine cluster protein [Methanolinea sp.]|nr:YkgJ family cysteine cluster protein [Methanolinea sp.]